MLSHSVTVSQWVTHTQWVMDGSHYGSSTPYPVVRCREALGTVNIRYFEVSGAYSKEKTATK